MIRRMHYYILHFFRTCPEDRLFGCGWADKYIQRWRCRDCGRFLYRETVRPGVQNPFRNADEYFRNYDKDG